MIEKTVEKSIYQKIGEEGLREVVREATPFCTRLFHGKYCRDVYREILSSSHTISDVLSNHGDRFQSERKFKKYRPRFRMVKTILSDEYGID